MEHRRLVVAVEWDFHAPAPDDDHLLWIFSGVRSSDGDDLEVACDEDDRAVTVTLRATTVAQVRPDGRLATFHASAFDPQAVAVRLSRPLGDRRVVDGSRPGVRPRLRPGAWGGGDRRVERFLGLARERGVLE